jgi:chemotaxis protein methyltransferase CheR
MCEETADRIFNHLAEFELDCEQYRLISSLLYTSCGIDLHVRKKRLVQARLARHLYRLGMNDFDEYLQYLDGNEDEFERLVYCLTTNFTTFFREPCHFEFLRREIIPRFAEGDIPRVRLWSAGCSSGEEVYSLAIVLHEDLDGCRDRDVLVLGTDISAPMLRKAELGEYDGRSIDSCDPTLVEKYFTRKGAHDAPVYEIKPELREIVQFSRLNLIDRWFVESPVDVVFFRNVMIYMDKSTQNELCMRFTEALKPGGYLFVGHSEGLLGLGDELERVGPSIYRKVPA